MKQFNENWDGISRKNIIKEATRGGVAAAIAAYEAAKAEYQATYAAIFAENRAATIAAAATAEAAKLKANRAADAAEHAAKAAAEQVVSQLERRWPKMRCVTPRLPRVATDQTVSLVETEAAHAVDALRPHLLALVAPIAHTERELPP